MRTDIRLFMYVPHEYISPLLSVSHPFVNLHCSGDCSPESAGSGSLSEELVSL